ncbi:MAG: hypothetical protein QM627_05115 [Luteolibacter sp.]
MKYNYIPLIAITALAASCEKSGPKPSGANAEAPAASAPKAVSADSDGKTEAGKLVDSIKARVVSGLPSYLELGEAEVTLEPAVGYVRRGVLLLPLVANADLYRANGKQAGDHQLLELVKKKGSSEPIRFRLIGETGPGIGWHWREVVEEDLRIDRNVKPLSSFKEALIQDSPEHLAFIKQEEDRQRKDAEETAALDVKAREEKLPPLKELLQPGRKAIGMIGDRYFHLVVAEATPSGTTWTFAANTMSQDGKKHFSDRGNVVIAYDPSKREVVVKQVTLGAMYPIRNTTVRSSDEGITFVGGSIPTTQSFSFK